MKVNREEIQKEQLLEENISSEKEILIPEGYVKVSDFYLKRFENIKKKGDAVNLLVFEVGQAALQLKNAKKLIEELQEKLEEAEEKADQEDFKYKESFKNYFEDLKDEYGQYELTDMEGYIRLIQQ